MLDTVVRDIGCPYCGEVIEIVVDPSVEAQEYIEDCSVCCQPIQIYIQVVGEDVLISARDENEV